jgi:hypothetical protein
MDKLRGVLLLALLLIPLVNAVGYDNPNLPKLISDFDGYCALTGCDMAGTLYNQQSIRTNFFGALDPEYQSYIVMRDDNFGFTDIYNDFGIYLHTPLNVSMDAGDSVLINGKKVCLEDGTNCVASGGGSYNATYDAKISFITNQNNNNLNKTANVTFNNLNTSGIRMNGNSTFLMDFGNGRRLNISLYENTNPVTTISSTGLLYIVAQNTLAGYFTNEGFNYADNMGMTLGAGGYRYTNGIYAYTTTQKTGTSTPNLQHGYLGVADINYSTPNYQAGRFWMIGDSSQRSVNRKLTGARDHPTLIIVPKGNESNIWGQMYHNNVSFNIQTSKGDINMTNTRISGNITIVEDLKLNQSLQGACTTENEGAIVYNITTHKHKGCNSTDWYDLY